MKKLLIILLALCFQNGSIEAQTKICGSIGAGSNPASSGVLSTSQSLLHEGELVIIPVVVHVIHNQYNSVGSFSNPSKSKIIEQIDILNDNFRKRNRYSIAPPAFEGIATDANIEFRLACIDPSGNVTDGITRTLSEQEFTVATPNSEVNEFQTRVKFTNRGGKNPWDTNRYLNIWVCRDRKSVV